MAKERRTGEHQDQSRRELETTKFNGDKKWQCYSLEVITYIYIWCFSKCSYWVYVIIENYKTNLKRKHHKIKLLAESLKKKFRYKVYPIFLIRKFSTVSWARWRLYSTCTRSDLNKLTYHYSKTKEICFLVCDSSGKFPENKKKCNGKGEQHSSFQYHQDWCHLWINNKPENGLRNKIRYTVGQSCELSGQWPLFPLFCFNNLTTIT